MPIRGRIRSRDAASGQPAQGGVAVCACFRTRRTRCARAWSALVPNSIRPRRSHACREPHRRRLRRRPVASGSISGMHRRGHRVSFPIADRKRRAGTAGSPAIRRPGSVRKTRDFVAAFSAHRMRPDSELSWHRATRLTDGREVLLPADLCLRRPPAQQEVRPPFPLSTGSAAGTSLGCCRLARPARTDRAGRGQPLVARRQPGQVDPARA